MTGTEPTAAVVPNLQGVGIHQKNSFLMSDKIIFSSGI
jgi:hypothetical protein